MVASLHQAVLVLAAAEKSKTALYIVGALLVGWAIAVSAMGLNRPDFPGDQTRTRAVIAISAVLVVATMATAIAVSGTPPKETPATAAAPPPSAGAPAAAATVALAADPTGALAFDKKTLSAKAGKVTIDFTNQSPIAHNVTIQRGTANVGSTPTFTGGTKTLTLTLKPGTYTFYCSVPGHRQGGMVGTLTVTGGSAKPAPGAPGAPATSPKATAPAPSAATTLALAADPTGQLSFNAKTLSAKAGKVTINFTNQSPVPHNVTVQQGSTDLGATPTFSGASKSLTLTLKPGTYTFYCSVPGHRQGGMVGTLTVQ